VEGRILLVEDDEDIMEMMSLYLHKHGFSVITATDGQSAMKLFERESPDLVLTDIVLPDVEGTEITRQIRKSSQIPVILMSCKNESDDIIDGLEMGADDYITKPFEPDVVIARVKSQLRRYRSRSGLGHGSLIWKDDYLEIDSASYQVRVNGEQVHLFPKELQLILLMAARPEQVFHVDQLFETIWGLDSSSDSRTVMVYIRSLRKKIEKDPAAPKYILTVRGFGYKFKL
jgi:DNA-binding response OmpR family regulator